MTANAVSKTRRYKSEKGLTRLLVGTFSQIQYIHLKPQVLKRSHLDEEALELAKM